MAREVRWTAADREALAAVRSYLESRVMVTTRVTHTDVLRFCLHRAATAVRATLDRAAARAAREGKDDGR